MTNIYDMKQLSLLFSMFLVLTISSLRGQNLEVISGVESGSYQQMANELQTIFPNLNVYTSHGSMENLNRLIGREKKEMAFVQEDVLVHQSLKDMEEGLNTLAGIEVLFPTGTEEIHLVVRERSRIKELDDLRNKRVNIGSQGLGTAITASMIKEITQLSWRDVYLDFDSAAKALVANKVDAVFFVGGAPVNKFVEISKTDPLRLIPLEDNRLNEIYFPSIIKASAYEFITEDVKTFSVKSHLIVNTNKLDNAKKVLLKDFLLAVKNNISTLKTTGHKKWQEVDFNFEILDWPVYYDAQDVFHPKPPLPAEIVLLSGVAGGSYEEFANDLKKVSGAVKEVRTSQGSVDNFRQLYIRENVYITMLQHDVLVRQKLEDEEFETNYTDDIRVLLPLALEEIHLITRNEPGITKIKDLKDKKVAVGTVNQGTRITTELVKEYTGGKWEGVAFSLDSALHALLDNRIDAFFFVGTSPISLLADLPADANIKLLPIEGRKLNEFYPESVIKAGTYSWLQQDIPTYSVQSVLATNVREETPEQKGKIQQLLNDIKINLDKLQTGGHPKWKQVTLDLSNVKWLLYEDSKTILE